MKLVIQIPAFNEEKTIGRTLADLPKKIEGIDEIEILVIDDGSSDRTAEAARKGGARVVRLLNHRGLAKAFTTGIDAALRAGADIIVNTDADNQYRGADVAKIVAPIINGTAEVVIGDRDVRNSPHMGAFKRLLQRIGSGGVSLASGTKLPDVTSGFRAFSREAAFQMNVFNPFTYTLETIIQAGHHNLPTVSVPIGTNAPTRASRLYRGIGSYMRKSIVTIFRVHTLYRPFKTFFGIGTLLLIPGVLLGLRFLYFYFTRPAAGHIQSLILAAVLLIAGFLTILVGLLADLISVNRRLSEDILVRLRKLEHSRPSEKQRKPRDKGDRFRPVKDSPGGKTETPAKPETQWVWLIDEAKLEEKEETPSLAAPPQQVAGKRRRRRRGPRHFSEARTHHQRNRDASPADTVDDQVDPGD